MSEPRTVRIFPGHALPTLTMPPGTTPEQEAAWLAVFNQFPVGTPEGGNQSVASVPSRQVVTPAGPIPATCTPAARVSAAGVAFSGEERA